MDRILQMIINTARMGKPTKVSHSLLIQAFGNKAMYAHKPGQSPETELKRWLEFVRINLCLFAIHDDETNMYEFKFCHKYDLSGFCNCGHSVFDEGLGLKEVGKSLS